MRSVLVCVLVLAPVIGREIAHAAEPTETVSQESGPSGGDRRPQPRRTIGRLGVGVQLGGFYDLGDPAVELRAWAKRVGFSMSLGRHVAGPDEPGWTEVFSHAGKQVTGNLLFAFINPKAGRSVPIKVYGAAGVVHTAQARGSWERVTPDGWERVTGVEGSTGYAPIVGVGAEIGFAGLPALAVGSELLFAASGEGPTSAIRFAVRYYVW